jgi:hypothetical protein
MPRNRMTVLRHAAWFAGSALTVACGQTATPASTDDGSAASAYEALSASLQACEDTHATCTTAAAGNATKAAACDTAAASCRAATSKQEGVAQGRLHNAAEGCCMAHAGQQHHAGGAPSAPSEVSAGSSGGNMQSCIAHKAPAVPACLSALEACLSKAGVSFGAAGAGSSTSVNREALSACVKTAHTCFVDEFASRRKADGGKGGPGHQGPGAGAGDRDNDKGPQHVGGAGGHAALPTPPHPMGGAPAGGPHPFSGGHGGAAGARP